MKGSLISLVLYFWSPSHLLHLCYSIAIYFLCIYLSNPHLLINFPVPMVYLELLICIVVGWKAMIYL